MTELELKQQVIELSIQSMREASTIIQVMALADSENKELRTLAHKLLSCACNMAVYVQGDYSEKEKDNHKND